jgi:hypothetical protein
MIVKKMFLYTVTIIVIVILTNCAPLPPPQTPQQPQQPQLPDQSIADVRAHHLPLPAVAIRPLVAELHVGQAKVSGTAEGLTMAEGPLRTSSIEAIRRHAILDALEKANADILLEPTFETVVKHTHAGVRGVTTVKVTGYPATYRNFRSSTDADANWIEQAIQLQHLQQQKVEIESVQQTPPRPQQPPQPPTRPHTPQFVR